MQINIKNINRIIDKMKPKPTKAGWQVRLKDVRRIQRWEKFDLNNAKQVWKNFEEVGFFTLNATKRNGDWTGIKDAWKNKPCFIVGSSISARNFDLNKLDGHLSIGVNHMIEYYDRFTWFLCQDHRFLRMTTYNLKKYKGRIFAHNGAPILASDYEKVIFFKTQYNRNGISLNPEDGLYTRCLTGLCMLHLALISGANLIYMIGMDTPKKVNMEKDGHHYQKNYTGEVNNDRSLQGTIGKYSLYNTFAKWKDRIINVCTDGYVDLFKKISIEDLNKILETKC